MNAIPIIAVLVALGLGMGASGRAAESGQKPPAPDKTLPRPSSETQPPLPIPPDHANGPRSEMKAPTNASMGAVDPKYKSGEPVSPR
jgi:hypothetical protein